jgi:putative membrane protein
MQLDQDFSRAIEAAVQRAEADTSAELVVVACARAGRYLDLSLIGGAIVALAAMATIFYLPLYFHPISALLVVAVAFAVATGVLHQSPGALRWLLPRQRRLREVARRADREFTRQQVFATPERNGLLILVCLLEDRVVILPDSGIDRHQPRAVWNEIVAPLRPARDEVSVLAQALERVGELLGRSCPKHERDLDDLPNAPRILP